MNWWLLLGIIGMASFIVAVGADDPKDKNKKRRSNSGSGGADLVDFDGAHCDGGSGDSGGDGGGD